MDSSPECTYSHLHNYAAYNLNSACEFALKYCDHETSFINTVALFYCDLHGNLTPMIPIAIVWLLVCFYLLSSTCENYLEPILSNLSKALNLSESLAGVTLLALGNGAPDIVATFIAGSSEHQSGINLAFGALFGASLFTTTIIFAMVVYYSKHLKLPRNVLIRDCGFYIISNLYLLGLGALPKISLGYAVGFVALYVVFIISVIYEEIYGNREESLLSVGLMIPQHHNQNYKQFEDEVNRSYANQDDNNIAKNEHQSLEIYSEAYSKKPLISQNNNLKFWDKGFGMIIKYLDLIEKPINWVRDFTIPTINENHPLNKIRISLYPFMSGLFAVWQLGILETQASNPSFWIVFFLCTIIIGILFRISLENSMTQNILSKIFLLLGLAFSIMWVRFGASLLMDLLSIIKLLCGLPANFIGLTILAWGNSLNDYFTDIAVAKKGYGIMAASGVFAGQFFNLQFGLGLLMITQSGTIHLDLYGGDIHSIINLSLVIFSIISLVTTLTYGLINKSNITSDYSKVLIILYLLACVYIGFVILRR